MTTPSELEKIVRATLDDRRLSRAEKKALEEVLGESGLTADQLLALRGRAFDLAKAELADPKAKALVEWLEDLVKVLVAHDAPAAKASAHSDAFFSPGEECLRAVIAGFGNARKAVAVCVFTITDDRISDAILAAHRRGVHVRIVTDNDKAYDEGSDVQRLAQAGVPVRVDQTEYHMHHKYAVFDGAYLLDGSYNWTRSAASVNEENVIVTSDARLVGKFTAHFEALWAKLA